MLPDMVRQIGDLSWQIRASPSITSTFQVRPSPCPGSWLLNSTRRSFRLAGRALVTSCAAVGLRCSSESEKPSHFLGSCARATCRQSS